MCYCLVGLGFLSLRSFPTAMPCFHSLALVRLYEELDLSLRFLVMSLPHEPLGAISSLPISFYGLWLWGHSGKLIIRDMEDLSRPLDQNHFSGEVLFSMLDRIPWLRRVRTKWTYHCENWYLKNCQSSVRG